MSRMTEDELRKAIEGFLGAFTTHDAARVLELCTPTVTFEMPFISDRQLTRADYHTTIQRTIPLMRGLAFTALRVFPLAVDNEAFAQYRGRATISRTGADYQQTYLSRFRFVHGKVDHFQENFDSAAFKVAFGLPPGWRIGAG